MNIVLKRKIGVMIWGLVFVLSSHAWGLGVSPTLYRGIWGGVGVGQNETMEQVHEEDINSTYAEPSPDSPLEGGDDACDAIRILIEYDSSIAPIGQALVNVLKLRLARYKVDIVAQQSVVQDDKKDDQNDKSAKESFEPVESQNVDWFLEVHLRNLADTHILVAMDYSGSEVGDDEVRKVLYEPDVEDMSWTLGLVIEETVSPYLEAKDEMAALGAGLAIIEPEVVGGAKKRQPTIRAHYPRFKDISLALNLSGIWSINEILVGPKVIIEGEFSRRTVASVSAGWSGRADYGAGGIEGTMSQIPIELLFGYVFWNSKHLEILGWGGFSIGFSVFKTRDGNSSRTDMTFQPGGNLFIQLVAKIYRPWAVFIQGGLNFPFVRDVLLNNGEEVYRHVWMMPILNMGIQLRF